MRYLKTLLVVLFAFLGTTAFAVNNDQLGSWAEDGGQYYLYNVSKKAYLCGGGSWNTHAWLESVPGNKIQLVKVEDKYRIKTFSKGNSNNYLGKDGNDPWMDKNTGYDGLFTFTEVEVEGFNVGYVISHSAGNLGASDYKVLFGQEQAVSTWVLISPDELQARLEGSIPEEGVDATHLIQNPGIANQSTYGDGFWNNGWLITVSDGTWGWGSNSTGGTSNTNITNEQAAEIWNGKFEIKQTLNSIPNGRYKASVYGYERVGNDNTRTDVDAYFYAGEKQMSLKSVGDYDASINTLDNAEKAMMAGHYLNGPLTVDVTTNSLNIGIVNPENQFFDWCVINNYQLTFLGLEPLLQDMIDKCEAMMPELDETNQAMLLNALTPAKAMIGTGANQADLEDMLNQLQQAYNTANALNIAKELAVNVLNDVPAALFPENFKWNLRDGEKWEDINGKEQMEINRKYKVYKNNAGRYKLASRLGVAMLIDFLQLADATDPETIQLIWDDMDEQDLQAWILSYFGHIDNDGYSQQDMNVFFNKFAQAYTGSLAEMLTKMARFVVESHGEGIALYEQNDPNYSRMYDAITGNTGGYDHLDYAYWWTSGGTDWRYYDDIEATLSDTYEMLQQWIGSGNNYYYNSNNDQLFFGFDPNFTAHITNPKFEDGLNGWTEEVQTVSWGHGVIPDGECMTNSAGENDYPYYDINNWGNETDGFKANVYQQIQLPAGRYMLTIAGRTSAPNIGDNDGNGIPDYLDGAFTTPTAANNSKYFQVYAINSNGIETAKSLMPQIGNADELEGNYWSNVHAVPGWNNYSVYGNGWNDVSVFFTMPSIGSATVGFKVETPVGLRNWASATNFRLTRLGDATLYFDENQTYDTELNWDPVNFFFATAPTDVVLHKNLKAGHWQSIALPVDVSAQQLANAFGEGTELAVPSGLYIHDAASKELIANFQSWDVLADKEGPVATKIYNYDYWTDDFGYEYPTGMIANVPYLIKPARVNASNLYVFHDVKSSETHGSKSELTDDGIWSWGSFNYTFGDDNTDAGFSAQVVDDEFNDYFGQIEFVPNYKFDPNFTDDFAVEYNDFSKAFGAKFVCPGDWKIVAAFMDDGFEIVTDQLNDMLALGQSRKDWYPGIPAAITKAMTKDPKVEGETDTYYFLKEINNGTFSADEKSWTSADGRITITAEGEDAYLYNYEDVNTYFTHESYLGFQYLMFGPGKYTVKANKPNELIYGYDMEYIATLGDVTVTQADDEVVEMADNGGYFTADCSMYYTGNFTPELSFTVEKGEFAAPIFSFFLLYTDQYTEYTEDEYNLIVETLKEVKSAITEAKKAYEPSKKFHALVAEAEELLNSDHDQLVENADALFKRTLQAYKARFDLLTNAEAIVALNELLAKAVEDYKTQIAPKIEVGDVIIYNVGAKKYFGAGNSWGTRSSLTEHGEYFTLARLENGAYTLESRYTNGGEQHFVGPNYFVDNGTAMELTIAPTSEEGVFTIACTGEAGFGYLGWDGTESTEIKVLEDKASKNAQWRITSVADMTAQLAEATVEAPKDATFLVKDANFSRNNRDAEAWDQQHGEGGNFRVGATSSSAGADQFNCSAEAWLVTFDVSQEVALPNGVYTVQAQAAITDYNNVGEGFPEVYAGEESTPFIVMEEGDQGSTMLQLQKAFAAGNYWTAPIVVEVTDGTLKIGARSDQNIFWAIWDNFVLTYYGDVDVNAVKDLFKVDGSDVTGINNINGADGQQTIYNVNGVRMNNAAQKGVYIINGKKVVK